jgi:PKD repeat protein
MIQSEFNGLIYSTKDSGKTWQLVASPTDADLLDLTVMNGDLYVSGTSGKLLKISSKLSSPNVYDKTRCGNGTVALTASSGTSSTIRWYDGPSANAKLIHTGDTLVTPSISQDTTYYASAYDTALFCESDRVPVKAIIHPMKKISLSINATADTLCEGEKVLFSSITNANHVHSYTWKKNGQAVGKDSSGLSLTDLKDKDTVWLEIRTADECQSDSVAFSNKKVFKVPALPKADFEVNNTEQCFRDQQFIFYNTSVSKEVISQRTWTINSNLINGKDTISHTFSKPGMYNVKLLVVNQYGCRDSVWKSITVFQDPQTESITGDSLVEKNTTYSYSVPASPGSTYKWWVQNGSGSGSTASININWNDSGSGFIKVLETSAEGCIGDTVRMRVKIQSKVSIAQISGPESIHVYPSPANDQLNIQLEKGALYSYCLYETGGRILKRGELKNGLTTVNVQSLPGGIYFLKLYSRNNGLEIYDDHIVINH